MRRLSRLLPALALLTALAIAASSARGATVTGVLTTYHGQLAPERQIHFENRVTQDIFLARTGKDGAFSADLPAGSYSLRLERGAIAATFLVGLGPVDVGTVKIPAPLYPPRLFQFQGVGEAIVISPAPSTANVPIYPDAPVEPKPAPSVSPAATPAPKAP